MKKIFLLAIPLVFAIVSDAQIQSVRGTPATVAGPGGYIKNIKEAEQLSSNLRMFNQGKIVDQFFGKSEEEEREEIEELYNKPNPMRASAKVTLINNQDVSLPPQQTGQAKLTAQHPGYTGLGNQPNGLDPSDAQIAAGPNHIVCLANAEARILNKQTGAIISQVSLAAFFSWSGFVFDPRIMYDPYGQRWVALALQNANVNCAASSVDSKFRVLISNNTDPTQGWFWYEIDVDANNLAWLDFAKLGFNKDYICIAGNIRCGSAPGLYVFPKAAAYSGSSLTYNFWNSIELASPTFTFDNSLDRLYLVRPGNANSAGVGYADSWYISGFPSPTLTASNSYGTSPWQSFANSTGAYPKQLGGPSFSSVNVFGHAIFSNCVYRNGFLWFTHAVFLPATGTTDRTSTQWWQVNPATGAVQQVGRIDDGSGATTEYYPSIAVNASSDAIVTYSIFNSTYYPGGAYNFRSSSDGAGQMPNGVFYTSGSGPDGDGRGGDYSQCAVDPLDDNSIWIVNQVPTSSWETRFALIPAYYGCYTDATFGNTVWKGYTKNEASGTITSAEMIQSPSMVDYDAGTRIILSPGFRANEGSRFRAYIEGCGNFRTGHKKPNAITAAPEIVAAKTGEAKDFAIYPNPSNQFFKITYKLRNEENVFITIYSYDMKPVRQVSSTRKSAGDHIETVDVKGLPPGVYFVQFTSGNLKRIEKMVVVH